MKESRVVVKGNLSCTVPTVLVKEQHVVSHTKIDQMVASFSSPKRHFTARKGHT